MYLIVRVFWERQFFSYNFFLPAYSALSPWKRNSCSLTSGKKCLKKILLKLLSTNLWTPENTKNECSFADVCVLCSFATDWMQNMFFVVCTTTHCRNLSSTTKFVLHSNMYFSIQTSLNVFQYFFHLPQMRKCIYSVVYRFCSSKCAVKFSWLLILLLVIKRIYTI